MNERLKQLSSYAQSVVHRVRVRSALNPTLWLSAIVTPVCFIAGWFFRGSGWLAEFLVSLGALPVLTAVGSFVYFAARDPDRLQSEDFQLRQRTLRIVEEQQDRISISAEAVGNLIGTERDEFGLTLPEPGAVEEEHGEAKQAREAKLEERETVEDEPEVTEEIDED